MIKKQSIRISKLRLPGLMKMIFYLRQSHCKLRSLNVIASDNPCNEIFKNVLLLNEKINYGKHYFKKFTQNRKQSLAEKRTEKTLNRRKLNPLNPPKSCPLTSNPCFKESRLVISRNDIFDLTYYN